MGVDRLRTPLPLGLGFLLGEMNIARGGDALLLRGDREQKIFREVLGQVGVRGVSGSDYLNPNSAGDSKPDRIIACANLH